MKQNGRSENNKKSGQTRGSVNLIGFMLALGFVWLVFDNLALAFLFALAVAGATEATQRATTQKTD